MFKGPEYNSYYHYIIAKFGDKTNSIVELPSPVNNYLTRYVATVQLFATAMYEENPVSVIFVIVGFVLLMLLLIIKIYLWKKQGFNTVWKWLNDIRKYAAKRFKELFVNRN